MRWKRDFGIWQSPYPKVLAKYRRLPVSFGSAVGEDLSRPPVTGPKRCEKHTREDNMGVLFVERAPDSRTVVSAVW